MPPCIWLALVAVASLWPVPIIADPASDGRPPKPVRLFLDVASDRLTGAGGGREIDADIAGMPLTLGARDSMDAHNFGITLGGEGTFTHQISEPWSFVGTGSFSKTHFMEAPRDGLTKASVGSGLNYRRGRLEIAFDSNVALAFLEDALDDVDYRIGGQVSQGLGSGFTLRFSGFYGRSYAQTEIADRKSNDETVFGLGYAPSERINLGFDYRFANTSADLKRYSLTKRGPHFAALLKLFDGFDLSADYCYAETDRFAGSETDPFSVHDTSHILGLGADINLSNDFDFAMTADYTFARSETTEYASPPDQHSGTISFTMTF